ncbi:hypothetical protein AAZX31_11G158600 [Glycine max]
MLQDSQPTFILSFGKGSILPCKNEMVNGKLVIISDSIFVD